MTDILREGARVYAVTLEDRLVCLDSNTGKEIWSFPSGFVKDQFRFNSAPAAASGRVYFGGLNGTLYALDARSGRVIWKKDLGARISTSLLLLGDSLFLGTSAGRLYRLEAKSGVVSGELSAEEPQGHIVAWGNQFFAFLGEKTVACLDAGLKKVLWKQTSAFPWSSARPFVWNDTLVVGNDHGELFGFRVTDGVTSWSAKFEGTIRGVGGSPDTLYIGCLNGTVYAWKP